MLCSVACAAARATRRRLCKSVRAARRNNRVRGSPFRAGRCRRGSTPTPVLAAAEPLGQRRRWRDCVEGWHAQRHGTGRAANGKGTRHVRIPEGLLDHGHVARVLLPRRRPGHGHGRVRHELRVLRVVAWEIRCCGGHVGGQRSIRTRAHGSADWRRRPRWQARHGRFPGHAGCMRACGGAWLAGCPWVSGVREAPKACCEAASGTHVTRRRGPAPVAARPWWATGCSSRAPSPWQRRWPAARAKARPSSAAWHRR